MQILRKLIAYNSYNGMRIYNCTLCSLKCTRLLYVTKRQRCDSLTFLVSYIFN